MARHYLIREVDFETMLNIVQACQNLQRKYDVNENLHGPAKVNMWSLLKGIVPGTKW